jgi:hypothetical protein
MQFATNLLPSFLVEGAPSFSMSRPVLQALLLLSICWVACQKDVNSSFSHSHKWGIGGSGINVGLHRQTGLGTGLGSNSGSGAINGGIVEIP